MYFGDNQVILDSLREEISSHVGQLIVTPKMGDAQRANLAFCAIEAIAQLYVLKGKLTQWHMSVEHAANHQVNYIGSDSKVYVVGGLPVWSMRLHVQTFSADMELAMSTSGSNFYIQSQTINMHYQGAPTTHTTVFSMQKLPKAPILFNPEGVGLGLVPRDSVKLDNLTPALREFMMDYVAS